MTTRAESAWARYRRQKREWKQYRARVTALPPDYRMVMQEIQKFVWNFATSDVTPVLSDVLDLLEEGAADGRPVLDITGDDVAGFCHAVLVEAQAQTWAGTKGQQLNARIHDRLDRREDDRDQ